MIYYSRTLFLFRLPQLMMMISHAPGLAEKAAGITRAAFVIRRLAILRGVRRLGAGGRSPSLRRYRKTQVSRAWKYSIETPLGLGCLTVAGLPGLRAGDASLLLDWERMPLGIGRNYCRVRPSPGAASLMVRQKNCANGIFYNDFTRQL
jgi:hypothetical protein